MSRRLAIGVAAVAGVAACGVTSSVVLVNMLTQVNDALLKSFSSKAWVGISRIQSLHREYQRLFPAGPLLWQSRIFLAMTLLSLLVCAWAVGFFG